MPNEPSASKKHQANIEKRRSRRIILFIPVRVAWNTPAGKRVQVEAETENVSTHGCLVRLARGNPPSGAIEITHGHTGETALARVTRSLQPDSEGRTRLAAQLAKPSEAFWGLGFRIQHVTQQLRDVDRSIRSGEIDARVLREFRQAVDHVRTTAWAVHNWLETQSQGRDPYGVLALLVVERIRRAAQANKELATDLDATEVTVETEGLESLFQSIRGLHRRLAPLFPKDTGTS